MRELFCPIHLIGRKFLHFEKTRLLIENTFSSVRPHVNVKIQKKNQKYFTGRNTNLFSL